MAKPHGQLDLNINSLKILKANNTNLSQPSTKRLKTLLIAVYKGSNKKDFPGINYSFILFLMDTSRAFHKKISYFRIGLRELCLI